MNKQPTPNLSSPRVVVDSPSSLVAVLPPILGYAPIDSVVLVLSGIPDYSSPAIMRADAPTCADVSAWAEQVAASATGARASGAHIVAWMNVPDSASLEDLPTNYWMGPLIDTLELAGIEVLGALTTNGECWWSHRCCGECVCRSGQLVDSVSRDAVLAEFVATGSYVAASRDELCVGLAPDLPKQFATMDALEALQAERAATRIRRRGSKRRVARDADRDSHLAWLVKDQRRDADIKWLTQQWIDPAHHGEPDETIEGELAARVILALADVRVRDTIMFRLGVWSATETQGLERTVSCLTQVLASAPPCHAAPSATVLSVCLWLRGRGSEASYAIKRALDDDPNYSLAQLVAAVQTNGISPKQWQSGMVGLTEEDCRRGLDPGRAHRGRSVDADVKGIAS